MAAPQAVRSPDMPLFNVRRLQRPCLAAVLSLSATLALAQGSAGGSIERIGTIKQVLGEVHIGTAVTPAVAGAGLRSGDRIVTGRDSGASVVLQDGTVLSLGPESSLDLSQYQFNPTTQEGNLLVELLQGSVRVITGLLAKVNPDRFKVKTPTAVVGVRGTDFIVEAQSNEPLYYYLRHHWKDHSRLRR